MEGKGKWGKGRREKSRERGRERETEWAEGRNGENGARQKLLLSERDRKEGAERKAPQQTEEGVGGACLL